MPFLGISQEMSISLFQGQGFGTNIGSEWFRNGPGLQLRYSKGLNDVDFWSAGVEMRTVNWGNQVAFTSGYQRLYAAVKENWSFRIGGEMIHGVVLFRPRSLYALGLKTGHAVRYQSKKRSFFQLDTAIGYNITPGYLDFGNINQAYELRLEISYGLLLGRQQKTLDLNYLSL